MRRQSLSIFSAVGLMIASSVRLQADAQLMTPDEYVSRLPYLHPTPTTDTTPMKIRVGSVVYEIPRNYIKSAVELMPTLWITYPQFQPPTPQTRCSSKNQLPVGPSDCVIIQLTIHGNIDGLLSRPLSNDILFNRMTKGAIPTRGPFSGPSEIQMYVQGGGVSQNKTEVYKTNDNTTLFYCNYSSEASQNDALCVDEITLDDGNAVHAFLYSYMIPYAPKFDAQVGALIATFKNERINQ